MIDPVTLAVIRGRLEQIVDEMDATLFRAAFSPVIAEARDGSHGIYHGETGETIAMGKSGLPVFIGAMSYATKAAIARAKSEGGLKAGDAYLLNDPYLGATHLNDIKIIKPFFRQGWLFCNLASVGHWADVGGNVPGNYNPSAVDSMQEGVRVPPVKLMEAGRLRQDIVDILLANSRLPKYSYGDLNAQLGALDLGEQRMKELLDEYGDEVVAEAMAEFTRRSARQMRSLIGALPDGTYSFEDHIDNDGLSDTPLKIALDLTIRGEEMTLDFSQSAKACLGPMNVARSTTTAACFVALKHLFPEVPANGGCLEPIRFVIPDGTILSAEAPKPVSGYTENIMRTIDVMFGTFAQVAPERANAACFATVNVLLLSGRRPDDSNYILFTFFGGGLGGNPGGDGLNHGNAPIGMATIPPAEVLEAAFPVYFTNWGLRQDSGGAGRHRGGLGCVYEVELLGDEASLVAFGERAKFPAFGILGGQAGAPNRVYFDQDGGRQTPRFGTKLPSVKIRRGHRVRIESPGGGGYGPPAERSVAAIARDIELELVSKEAAARDYGIAIAGDGSVQRRGA
jgi:N-methylhydantoinase B